MGVGYLRMGGRVRRLVTGLTSTEQKRQQLHRLVSNATPRSKFCVNVHPMGTGENDMVTKEQLIEAAKKAMTPKEVFEQRVSWVMGMNHHREVTREQAVEALAYHGFIDPAPEATREAAITALKEERSIVDRIWDMFGRPSYEQLAGRSIFDLIKEVQERAAICAAQHNYAPGEMRQLECGCRFVPCSTHGNAPLHKVRKAHGEQI